MCGRQWQGLVAGNSLLPWFSTRTALKGAAELPACLQDERCSPDRSEQLRGAVCCFQKRSIPRTYRVFWLVFWQLAALVFFCADPLVVFGNPNFIQRRCV